MSFSPTNIGFGLRLLQLLPNGLGGTLMSLDFIHKQVRRDFVEKMRFPVWFPTLLGCYKLSQAALNWVAGGYYVPIAQLMMAFQLGGAAFTHAVVEGKGFAFSAQAPVLVFFSTTLTIQALGGAMPLPAVVASHACVAAIGYASGYVILALGPGGLDHAEALSPVKWRAGGAAGFPKGKAS